MLRRLPSTSSSPCSSAPHVGVASHKFAARCFSTGGAKRANELAPVAGQDHAGGEARQISLEAKGNCAATLKEEGHRSVTLFLHCLRRRCDGAAGVDDHHQDDIRTQRVSVGADIRADIRTQVCQWGPTFGHKGGQLGPTFGHKRVSWDRHSDTKCVSWDRHLDHPGGLARAGSLPPGTRMPRPAWAVPAPMAGWVASTWPMRPARVRYWLRRLVKWL